MKRCHQHEDGIQLAYLHEGCVVLLTVLGALRPWCAGHRGLQGVVVYADLHYTGASQQAKMLQRGSLHMPMIEVMERHWVPGAPGHRVA